MCDVVCKMAKYLTFVHVDRLVHVHVHVHCSHTPSLLQIQFRQLLIKAGLLVARKTSLSIVDRKQCFN